ncbi:MAG TPA: sugar transferase [Longimicrobiaceae bacterium]|nr:sugar transferase [Longimicrobiaceae bacterium]
MSVTLDRVPSPELDAPARLDPLRRALDIASALLLLVLSSPLLLLGAMLVLLGSGRPVFFGHVRVGQGGRSFRCWKLRTMTPGAESWLTNDPMLRERHARNGYKLPTHEDPRVTRVGAWLRRTHIDELPQLVNVLNGTMSLVGPRPIVEEELAHYGGTRSELLTVPPGVVGAWTSRGRRRPPYPERARVELAYLRARSLRGDLRILVETLPVLVRGQED